MKLFRISNPRLHENIFIAIKDIYHPRVGDKFVVAPSLDKQPVLVCELVEEVKSDSTLRPDIFGVGFHKIMNVEISDPRLDAYSKKLKEANRQLTDVINMITKSYSSSALSDYKLPELDIDACYYCDKYTTRYFRDATRRNPYIYALTNSSLELDDCTLIINDDVVEEVTDYPVVISNNNLYRLSPKSKYTIVRNKVIYKNRKLAQELNKLRYLLGNEFYKIVDIHSYVR